jgi:hypothetical protein
MRNGLEESRERGGFGSSRDVGRLDTQRPKGVGAHKSNYRQNSKNLPAGSNSSKRGLTVRGMFPPSDLRASVRNLGVRRRSVWPGVVGICARDDLGHARAKLMTDILSSEV